MAGYIFNANKGETPEQLARQREIVEAMMANNNKRVPQNVGEGLATLGQALSNRFAYQALAKKEAASREAGNAAFAPIVASLGGQFPAAPGAEMGASAAPTDYPSARVAQAFGDSGGSEIEAYIRQAAQQRGIDPETAIKVAMSEGGVTDPYRQSDFVKNGVREQSFGPFQLYMGGGLGNDALAQGIDPRKDWKGGIDFALDQAKKGGWGPWYGAQRVGITGMEGIGQQPAPQMAQAQPDQLPAMAGGTADTFKAGSPTIQMLMQAMSNPNLSDQQRGIVNMLLGRQMDASDPVKQLQLQKLKNEVAGEPFTLSPGEARFGPDGKQIAAGAPKAADLPSAVQEYEYAKGQGFQGTFQDWEASKKGGMSFQVDPETGAVSFQQGANIKPLTEGQSKDTVFATRASGALPLIDKFGDALTSLPETVGGKAPVVGNYMKSPEFQQAEQAGKEFLQAILRKDTGAAITAAETDEYRSVYLPRPGDSPELLAQKKAARTRALEAIKAGMPPQALLYMERALGAGDKPPAKADRKKVIIDGATIEEID